MIPKIANKDARDYVRSRKEFKGSNLFAEWVTVKYTDENGHWQTRDVYVVASYGKHWPLFVYDDLVGVWFENMDRYSVTTSKHKSQAHPNVPTIACDKDVIRDVIANGVNAVVLRGEAA